MAQGSVGNYTKFNIDLCKFWRKELVWLRPRLILTSIFEEYVKEKNTSLLSWIYSLSSSTSESSKSHCRWFECIHCVHSAKIQVQGKVLQLRMSVRKDLQIPDKLIVVGCFETCVLALINFWVVFSTRKRSKKFSTVQCFTRCPLQWLSLWIWVV